MCEPTRLGADGLWIGRSEMKSVRVGSIAKDLGVDFGAPCERIFQPLEHKDGGAFAYDETIAIFVERTAGVVRVIIAT